MDEGASVPPRRRRSPEEAEREILEAAESFLMRRPFREMTVGELMARTGLSRQAFYVYFGNRYGLVERLLGRSARKLFEMEQRWLEGEASREVLRETIEQSTAFFSQQGPLLRAIADASAGDPKVEQLYRFGFIERFVDAVAARIREGVEGQEMLALSEPEQVREVARALVWMSERYWLEMLGRRPQEPIETVVEALYTVWVRTLYGFQN